jgi:GNAT superfamily N-acetyltransferase
LPGTDYSIRTMTLPELQKAVDWAAAEGWNPGLHDAAAYYATDPGGFLAGFADGEMVSSISVVNYDGVFGFLGFYIVAPSHRGTGLGHQLWQRGMERLGDVPVVGLDGVVDQQGNYTKSGYVLAHRNIRHAGPLVGQHSPRAIDAGQVDFARLVAFDAAHYPAPRGVFLRHWLELPESVSLALVGPSGALTGLGTIRRCREGWRVGPLFASNPADAETLLLALAARIEPGVTVFLDTPEPNAQAVAVAQRHGMTPMFETARMYRGPDPQLPLERIFGITTLELG